MDMIANANANTTNTNRSAGISAVLYLKSGRNQTGTRSATRLLFAIRICSSIRRAGCIPATDVSGCIFGVSELGELLHDFATTALLQPLIFSQLDENSSNHSVLGERADTQIDSGSERLKGNPVFLGVCSKSHLNLTFNSYPLPPANLQQTSRRYHGISSGLP